MAAKYTIYAGASASTFNASSYYRIVLPLWTMHRLGLVHADLDSMSSDVQWEDRYKRAMTTDFNLMYQVCSGDVKEMIKQTRFWPYQTAPDGAKLAPPSFIVDTDDDLFNVHPMNPAFKTLGYKDDKGNELAPGQKIWTRDPITNEPQLLWADGENVSFELNKQQLDNWREIMQLSELITCSTEGTKRMVLREIGEEYASKIHINPNCIDFTEYPRIDLAPTDEVRILWQGSPTHWEDWWAFKEQAGNVARKYKNVKFIIWGVDYKWLFKEIPSEQLVVLPWMDYRNYKLRASTLGHDIALAPLKNTQFNQSRSAIKMYEAAAVWKPAATLAQKTGVFAEEIQDGVTGLLFETPEEFETKLCELIEDSKKRKEIAANAKDWVRENRDPSTHAIRLYERLDEVRKARMDWPELVNEHVKKKHSNTGRSSRKSMRKRGKR